MTAPPGRWRRPLLAAFGLAFLTIVLYWPAVDFRLLAFDDPYYTQNDIVQGGWNGANIGRAFLELPEENLYMPLTQLSYMVDVEIFGNSPRGFHLTNILLHSVNMVVLFLLLWRMTGSVGKSALAAAIVAAHPLRVETVAWVTERKGLLSFFFLLLTMACHLRYARSGNVRWYAAAFLCAACGMLAKPIAVTLPVLLLLCDYWPLGRLRGDAGEASSSPAGRRILARIAEKIPFAALSVFTSLVTLRLQSKMSLHTDVAILSRLEHSVSSFFIYLFQTAWPLDLAFRFYRTPWDRVSGAFLPAAAGLVFVTAVVVRYAPRRPYLAFGWFWYLASLFPVSGIVPTGVQWISDRFTYIPHIGLAVALVWLGADRSSRLPRSALAGISMLVLVPLVVLTRGQLPDWKDGASLFGTGFEANAGDPRYIAQYAAELTELGDYARSRRLLEGVLPFARDPRFGVNIQREYLLLLERTGKQSEAVVQAHAFLKETPKAWSTRLYLADFLMAGKRYPEAMAEYRRVAEGEGVPKYDRGYAFEGLGISFLRTGEPLEAVKLFREGVRLQPASVSLHYNLARALAAAGDTAAAREAFGKALKIAPGNLRVRLEFAEWLERAGSAGEAALRFEEVARLAQGRAEGMYAQGRVLEAAGRKAEAAAFYKDALRAQALFPGTTDAARRRLETLP
ncbi:MAG: tetratricopeptide repeat protein [Deltaproteobacteria bacterium]